MKLWIEKECNVSNYFVRKTQKDQEYQLVLFGSGRVIGTIKGSENLRNKLIEDKNQSSLIFLYVMGEIS